MHLHLIVLVAAALLVACDASSKAKAGRDPSDRSELRQHVTKEPALAADDPDPGIPKRIFAKRFVVKVRAAPSRDAPRIGYLRGGAVLSAKTASSIGSDGCRGGWYELTTGGYVCNGRDVVAFDGNRLPEARATQPDLEALLPYRYGYARRDNIPVFRRIPTDEEAVEFEGYVIPGSETSEEEAITGSSPQEERRSDGSGRPEESRPPSVPAGIGGEERADSSERASDQAAESHGSPAVGESPSGPTPEAPTAGQAPRAAAPEPALATAAAETGTDSGEEKAEPEQPPTLDSLQSGDRDSVLLRRMMRGFYVSLDRDFRSGARRYLRTQQNEYIPYTALGFKRGSEFQGEVLGEERGLPLAFILSRRTRYYEPRGEDRAVARQAAGYHHRFFLDGDVTLRNREYWRGDRDRLYRKDDVVVVERGERPAEVPPGSKWIDVDLTRQALVAYEDDVPVFATLISSGIIKREDVPELNHATPTGVFQVKAKHLTTTMDGDNAFDGPYSIQDVAYVMYYEQGYATHAAFWHNLFGRPKSHGCINLSPRDAAWLFHWADPVLPPGWHGVYPTDDSPGTYVVVRGETPQ